MEGPMERRVGTKGLAPRAWPDNELTESAGQGSGSRQNGRRDPQGRTAEADKGMTDTERPGLYKGPTVITCMTLKPDLQQSL